MRRNFTVICLSLVLAACAVLPFSIRAQPDTVSEITILCDEEHLVNRIVPSHAFGAALDGHEQGEVKLMLSPSNIREMLSAGLKPLSYRLRTELAGEAWHWNPRGRLKGGYWNSSDLKGPAISVSYGYRLPRRGNTFDQANDDGYSRIDDGDTTTFWKSNPYLDQHFTGEPDSTLPQWVLVDLGEERPVDAIEIQWAQPYATRFEVQHGRFSGVDDISQSLPDRWQTFPSGSVVHDQGGMRLLRLSTTLVSTRFVRILLHESSKTSNRQSTDLRDRLGYAIRELKVGLVDSRNQFHDYITHTTDKSTQTPIYVSSTDPWHRLTDRDSLIEQPGFDRVFKSGLTNRLPMLTPVSVLYGVPEDAAAELRYLKSRGYSVERIELGEEPDGQFVTPEDFAALYLQFASALHSVDPTIKLGGPSFQDIAEGKDDWLDRFLNYLKQRDRLQDVNFISFEWYPFDDVCRPTPPQLRAATKLLTDSLRPLRAGDTQRSIPWIMTEYGYSAFGSRAEIDIEGALLNADAVGNFLTLGGEQTFLYGYEPNYVISEGGCSRGNNMLFMIGDDAAVQYRMPTYYGARLMAQEWVKPGDEVHRLYKVENTDDLVTAYAVVRPDKQLSLMIINKDADNSHSVRIHFGPGSLSNTLDFFQYSRKQYQLSGDVPTIDLPPEHRRVQVAADSVYSLPPYSLTIIRGAIN